MVLGGLLGGSGVGGGWIGAAYWVDWGGILGGYGRLIGRIECTIYIHFYGTFAEICIFFAFFYNFICICQKKVVPLYRIWK